MESLFTYAQADGQTQIASPNLSIPRHTTPYVVYLQLLYK